MFTSVHHSLVQYDTEKSTVSLQPAVVLDESELAELVHEKVDARLVAGEPWAKARAPRAKLFTQLLVRLPRLSSIAPTTPLVRQARPFPRPPYGSLRPEAAERPCDQQTRHRVGPT